MAETQGTTVPPYPSLLTQSRTLLRHLGSLRGWVLEQQAELVEALPQAVAAQLKVPPELGSEGRWEAISVTDKYTVLMYLRQIREGWDQLLRDHEDAWNSQAALIKRARIVGLAHYVLAQAFVDPETREAKTQAAQEAMSQRMRLVSDQLQVILLTPQPMPPPEAGEAPLSNLFDGSQPPEEEE